MIKNKLFHRSGVDHVDVIETLVSESSPRKTFLLLVFLSSVIATLGLLNDAPEVVIGAMLVAPVLWPVLSLGMGIIVWDKHMLKMAFMSILLSVLVAVVTAMVITFFYVPIGTTHEMLRVTNVGFMLPVSIFAAAAAVFSLVYKEIREAVTGVAISVALLPPMTMVGIGLGGTDWGIMQKASELLLINLAGIIGTAAILFAVLGFHGWRKTAESVVKKEEKILNAN